MTSTTDDRNKLEELLPFYLNGTLDDVEQQKVETALAEDEELQFELEFLKAVQTSVRSRDPGNSPGEFGLARLNRDIDREQSARGAQINQSRSNIWRIAAVVAIGLFSVQSAIFVSQSGFGVELAGGGDASVDGETLTVGFSAEATEGEIRDLLLELELEIVGGPSALGLYSVVVPTDQSVADALTALRAADDIVESAEED